MIPVRRLEPGRLDMLHKGKHSRLEVQYNSVNEYEILKLNQKSLDSQGDSDYALLRRIDSKIATSLRQCPLATRGS